MGGWLETSFPANRYDGTIYELDSPCSAPAHRGGCAGFENATSNSNPRVSNSNLRCRERPNPKSKRQKLDILAILALLSLKIARFGLESAEIAAARASHTTAELMERQGGKYSNLRSIN